MVVGPVGRVSGRDWDADGGKHKGQDNYRWHTRTRPAAGASGKYERAERALVLNRPEQATTEQEEACETQTT